VERTVYDFLNFLRDVGGLNGILVNLISKLSTSITNAYFVSAMFKQRINQNITHSNVTDSNIKNELEKNFRNREEIPFYNIFETIYTFCFSR
jgi:hypothetical protein